MTTIEEKEQEIRDWINHPWKQGMLLKDRVRWNKLCSCLDIIGDTQIAIKSYFDLPKFDAESGGYLYLYGLLQAFFLQQDSLNHMSDALFNKPINWRKDYPDLFYIRELRNDSIGHPTNRGNNDSFHFIARYSISKGHFMILSSYSKDYESVQRSVFLDELRNKQESSVCSILDSVIELIKQEFQKHKESFMDTKMIDLLPDSYSYCLGKVYEGVYNKYPLVQMNFDEINRIHGSIKQEVIKRYGETKSLQGLHDVIRRIDYILSRLRVWVEKDELLNNYDAEVFLDSLSDRLIEIKGMLVEMDNEF
jgi:hypothetical protein